MGTTMTKCTACGAVQPLIAAYEATEARAAWETALRHHPLLAPLLIRYLDLFARPGKQPRESTVARVLHDLLRRIHGAEVRGHGITHPAPLDAWEAALRICTGADADISLPLKNNHYLAAIVWRRADGAAGRRERKNEELARNGAGANRSGRGMRSAASHLSKPTEAQKQAGRAGAKAARAALTGDDDHE